MLSGALPTKKFGWVPWKFLFDRTIAFFRNGPYSLKRSLVAFLGFGLDFIAFVAAQIKMARGKGAGYW